MTKLLCLPGLIDIHVHLRDPGQTQKEDFYTGTCAALAGGITTVFDMPNNINPVFHQKVLEEKSIIAEQKAVCDYGLYFGTDGKNTRVFGQVAGKVVGLKVYLSLTTGKYVINDEDLMDLIFRRWPKQKIIVIHAEGDRVDLAIKLGAKHRNKFHITHINTKETLEKVIEAKKEGLNLTCDVTPHHLCLTESVKTSGRGSNTEDVKTPRGGSECLLAGRQGLPRGGGICSEGFYTVKPPLAKKEDQEFLWNNIDKIDCICTDHAPHTINEKQSINPPAGVPGLETMLPLLLTAIKDGCLSLNNLIRLTNINPQKIFGFKQDKDTYVEVAAEQKYIIENRDLKTKCGWSPFSGREITGKVKKVFIRGSKVFEDGKILVNPGFGKSVLLDQSLH